MNERFFEADGDEHAGVDVQPSIPGEREIDLAALREKLDQASGPQYWRSLEEAAETEEFREMVHREFPSFASEWNDGWNRRRFVQLMGASLALGGLAACTRQPLEKIVPYVKQPEDLLPGRPMLFATASTFGGYATGLLVQSHLGRPTKVEGNPDHPASRGGTDAQTQASILDLYDPDRIRTATHLGNVTTWEAVAGALKVAMEAQKGLQGIGLRILTGNVTSPTLAAQLRKLLAENPRAKWHQWEPASGHAARAAAKSVFGSPVALRYDLSKADVLLTLDSDLLTAGAANVRHARDFASRRRVEGEKAEMNRYYAVESLPTPSATLSDHRLALPPSEVASFAAALAKRLGAASSAPAVDAASAKFLEALAKDLEAHRGTSLVVAGDHAPAAVHVLAAAINEKLGNVGKTVTVTDPVEAEPTDQAASIADLVADMKGGKVDLLLLLGGNPVFDAPADLDFGAALQKVPNRFRLALHDDETTEWCHWVVPATHDLESWTDARAFDGTVTIVQPLIDPLYDSKTPHQLLAALAGNAAAKGDEPVREFWKSSPEMGGLDFEKKWRRALHDGLVAGSELPAKSVSVRPGAADEAVAAIAKARPAAGGVEVLFRPDPTLHDGRFANNGWLQELPKPLTKVTWDNPALVAPKLAESLGLRNGDVVKVSIGNRSAEVPIWITPGHADRTVTLFYGPGRKRVGRVGKGTGFDLYPLRTAASLDGVTGAAVSKAGRRVMIAATEGHFNIDDMLERSREAKERNLVRTATLAELRKDPDAIRTREERELLEKGEKRPSIYPGFEYKGNAWGLSIDLNVCTGCNGCVLACQAENNIPIVGKEQVANGREMHWIRIDRYYEGSLDLPVAHHQPVTCMHCEQAPCEVVCPVAATVHSDEGLNDMVYNRCVGTRYCSNNCPYKVRRFNFLSYTDWDTPVTKLLRNPDVSVRSRGVMEKCTYCVQRINRAKIEAEKENRPVRDGEITTACQQACPAQAIVFGNVNDPTTKVSQAKHQATSYGLLENLNTRPRTTYLAKLRNPNPELERG